MDIEIPLGYYMEKIQCVLDLEIMENVSYYLRDLDMKSAGKIGLDVTTNLILPAVDEVTDLISGIRYFV